MLKRILLIFTSVVLMSALTVTADDIELMGDGSFENGMWQLAYQQGATKEIKIVQSDEAYDGNSFLQFEIDSDRYGEARYNFIPPESGVYEINGFVKTNAPAGLGWLCNVAVAIGYQSYTSWYPGLNGQEPPLNEWTEFTFDANLIGDTEYSIRISNGTLKDGGVPGSELTFYYDKLSVYPKGSRDKNDLPPVNLLKNSDFDEDEGWELTAPMSISSENAYNGTSFLSCAVTGDYSGECSQIIKPDRSGTHQIKGYVKTNVPAGLGWLNRILILDGEKKVSSWSPGTTGELTPLPDWTAFAFDVNLTIGKSYTFKIINDSILGTGLEDIYFSFDALSVMYKTEEAAGSVSSSFVDSLRGTRAEDGNIRIVINDRIIELDQPPIIVENRIMVPARAVLNALGARVEWNEENMTVTASDLNRTIVLQMYSSTAIVNERNVGLDMPPLLHGQRAYVPVRFVSEVLGSKVDWMKSEEIVVIH